MSVPLEEVRSVRIVCDLALKDGVFMKLELGISGFTWWAAHGMGHHETVPDVQTASGWNRGLGSEDRICVEA